ncbi:MAG: hypothetical protein AB7P33_00430 [Dehalococcoidia bacterium]
MDLNNTNELADWSARVRKVDSSLHAAFARQEREAARKQPFWRRGRGDSQQQTANERKQALQGSIV